VSQALLARPQQALDVLAREELGLNPDVWAPRGARPVPRSSRSQPALRGALRMVLIGGGAGAVSFFVGRALGVAIG
jgi:hypothetical protein